MTRAAIPIVPRSPERQAAMPKAVNATIAANGALGFDPRNMPSATAARMTRVRSTGPSTNTIAINSSAAEATST